MTTREIIATFKEMYDADVSPMLILKITAAVKELVKGAYKKWSMPIQDWSLAMIRFIIEFGDRLSDHR